MTDQPTKTCSMCHHTKDIDHFYKDRSKRDGLNSRCIQCLRGYLQENRRKGGMIRRGRISPAFAEQSPDHPSLRRTKAGMSSEDEALAALKECMLCRQKKEPSSFHPHRRAVDRLTCLCRKCLNQIRHHLHEARQKEAA